MARDFDGTEGFISGVHYNDADLLSISFWCFMPSGGSVSEFDRFFELGGNDSPGSNSNEDGITVNIAGNTSNMRWIIWQDGSNSNIGTFAYPTDQWFHCVITSDAASPATLVYKDGVLEINDTSAVRAKSLQPIAMARTVDTGSQRLECRQARYAIWEGALLTLDEVKALHLGVSPLRVRRGALVDYYPLTGVHDPEFSYVTGRVLTKNGTPVQINDPPVMPDFARLPRPLIEAAAPVPVVKNQRSARIVSIVST